MKITTSIRSTKQQSKNNEETKSKDAEMGSQEIRVHRKNGEDEEVSRKRGGFVSVSEVSE